MEASLPVAYYGYSFHVYQLQFVNLYSDGIIHRVHLHKENYLLFNRLSFWREESKNNRIFEKVPLFEVIKT